MSAQPVQHSGTENQVQADERHFYLKVLTLGPAATLPLPPAMLDGQNIGLGVIGALYSLKFQTDICKMVSTDLNN